MSKTPKPVVLCILDGWGLDTATKYNAVAQARTPHYDLLCQEYPVTHLTTHGNAVGLPEGQMGNSEVGHTNIGAGRVVWMDLPKIDTAIRDNTLTQKPALQAFIDTLKDTGGTAHLMGLVSPGGVHAHQRHIAALACILSLADVPVKIHAFLDGRDTPPSSAKGYMDDFQSRIEGLIDVDIATMSGRFFAMDRDNRWDRVEQAYKVIAHADGRSADSTDTAFGLAKQAGETDEFVQPTVVLDGYQGINPDTDGLLMANFRSDRARELLSALADPDFDGFTTPNRPAFAACLGMVEYSTTHSTYMDAIFPQETIDNTLGQWVSAQGKTQLRLAETEKYPHVTFFMNGGVEAPYPGEERIMAPSPKVKTYDLKPEMAAAEVCAHLVTAIKGQQHDLIIANFANPDMVGHTGDLPATVKAVEAVDTALGQILEAIADAKGAIFVTADHGNCEVMRDPATGIAHTAHTTNPVPAFLVDASREAKHDLKAGALCDIAPTLLALLGLEQPPQMTGISLLNPAS